MDKIIKFFECLLPTSQCNLSCEYCYIIQEKRRGMRQIELDYSIEHIRKALSKKRIGGIAYFSLCGTGETFLQKETVLLAHQLLLEGHYVNITTNGTVTKRIEELINFDKTLLNHLHISFSLHYIELIKNGMLNVFFDNVNKVKDAGCSILVQLNLYDGYIPYIEEIKNVCLERVGALPQIAVTRWEKNGDANDNIELYTEYTQEEYINIGKMFNSPLFEFTLKNFNVKRNEFCYAGEWSFNLDMKTGNLRSCYASGSVQNIFKNLNTPIKTRAVGHDCKSIYCINSSHFISLGVIPEYISPSYGQLRNRKEAGWYSKEMEQILDQKLYDNNKKYGVIKKMLHSNYVKIKKKIKKLKVRRIG